MRAIRKKPVASYVEPARTAYGRALEQVRLARFYTEYGVPDTLEGRFDLLLLHAFLIVNRLTGAGAPGAAFNQALFDALFADMDQGLRESGIGDMGVPKRMRRMMKAFNGRMHAYSEALDDPAVMGEALRRNLYGTAENPSAAAVTAMAVYVVRNVQNLAAQDAADLLAGQVSFVS